MPLLFACPHCGHQTEVDDRYLGQTGPCAKCGRTVSIPRGSGPIVAKPVFTDLETAPRDRPKTSLIVLLAIVAMCGCGGPIIVALLLPAVQSAREAARRSQCANNLRQLGLAMHNYHDVYKSFPAGFIADENGNPMHSWRVAILPFLEQSRLYEQYNFDEPWNSTNNLRVAQQMPKVFKCPSSPISGPLGNLTHYVVILSDRDADPRGSMFSENHWTKIHKVRDGTSRTIMIVEARDPVEWTKPVADLQFEELRFDGNGRPVPIGSYHSGIAQALMADGSIHVLAESIDGETMKRLIQPSDGKAVEF